MEVSFTGGGDRKPNQTKSYNTFNNLVTRETDSPSATSSQALNIKSRVETYCINLLVAKGEFIFFTYW